MMVTRETVFGAESDGDDDGDSRSGTGTAKEILSSPGDVEPALPQRPPRPPPSPALAGYVSGVKSTGGGDSSSITI